LCDHRFNLTQGRRKSKCLKGCGARATVRKDGGRMTVHKPDNGVKPAAGRIFSPGTTSASV